jgi:group I intron endonuclease
MVGIYKITSPSNKIYVGQSIDIERRFKIYKRLDCKGQTKIYRSLIKYGCDNHIFELIEECNIDQLKEREIYWKQYYNSVNDGLNCELFDGGEGPRSEHTKKKISNSMKGKIKSEEHCLNLSKSKLGIASKRKGKPDLKQQGIPKPGAGGKDKPKIGAGPKTGNHIICTKTNNIFTSVKQCMDINNIHKAKMFRLLKLGIEYQYINKNYYR